MADPPPPPTELPGAAPSPPPLRRRRVLLLGLAILVLVGAAALLVASQRSGSSGPTELVSARDFRDVLADGGIDCDNFETYDLDAPYSETIFNLSAFSGTVTDAGYCTLDEADLVPEDEWLYGDAPFLISTDVYLFRAEADAEHYASLMKTDGCGGDGESYMFITAKSWIAVLEFDGSDKVPEQVADALGASWSRVAC